MSHQTLDTVAAVRLTPTQFDAIATVARERGTTIAGAIRYLVFCGLGAEVDYATDTVLRRRKRSAAARQMRQNNQNPAFEAARQEGLQRYRTESRDSMLESLQRAREAKARRGEG